MGPLALDVSRKEAGADYLASVEMLGLRPTALFWAFDKTLEQFVLVLTTPMFDYAGPLELSKVLIEAYRKSGTPKEIDPFIVQMHSPEHAIIREMAKFMPFNASAATVSDPSGRPRQDIGIVALTINTGDLEVSSNWVYRFEKPAPVKTVEASRRWRRFVDRVDKLAA